MSEKRMEKLQKALSDTNISDYLIREFDGNNLILLGSFDLSYYFEIKFSFYKVDYINCPTYFSANQIRFATVEEKNRYREECMIEPEDLMIVFEDDTFKTFYFIICENFRYELGLKDINSS